MGNAPGSPSSEKSYFDSIDETACQSDDYFDEKGKLPRYKVFKSFNWNVLLYFDLLVN